jgi:hypothetical protein
VAIEDGVDHPDEDYLFEFSLGITASPLADEVTVVDNTVRNVTTGITVNTVGVARAQVVDNAVIHTPQTQNIDRDDEGFNRAHKHGIAIVSDQLLQRSDLGKTGEFRLVVRGNTLTGPAGESTTEGVLVYTATNPPVDVEANTVQDHARGVQVVGPDFASQRDNCPTVIALNDPGRVCPINVQDNRIEAASQAGVLINEETPVRHVGIHGNVFPATSDYGVLHEDPQATVNATNNYWGAPSGPSSPGTSSLADPGTGAMADGAGSAVSASSEEGTSNVRFDPWLGQAPD